MVWKLLVGVIYFFVQFLSTLCADLDSLKLAAIVSKNIRTCIVGKTVAQSVQIQQRCAENCRCASTSTFDSGCYIDVSLLTGDVFFSGCVVCGVVVVVVAAPNLTGD